MSRTGFMFLIIGVALAGFVISGCQDAQDKPAACKDKSAKAPCQKTVLCGQCGEVKSSGKCCKPGMKKCGKCGLHKGSPGCCKMAKGKDVTLCSKCGEIKGSDKCCKPGAKKCVNCGKDVGSPGCCLKARMEMAQ